MLKITIYDDFFKKELTGVFEDVEECKEWYSQELDCMPDDIKIISIENLHKNKNAR